jgi:DNA-binding CsgD family transcriptional regulator
MARSKRLSLRDVRAVFRLVGECRELGADVVAWRRHLAAGLCRLTGAQVGFCGENEYSAQVWKRIIHYEDLGWACAADRQRAWELYQASGTFGQDLVAERLFRKLPIKLQTFCREQVISSREWGRSITLNDFLRRGRVDLAILSQQTFGSGTRTNTVVLLPLFGEAPLPERSRRLVHLAQQELHPLLGTVLAAAGQPGWSSLPPRWRQTLGRLLEGDSEKQVALRLGISRATVHEYVTGLYRHFGVSSRGELLAFFIRRYSAAPPWLEPSGSSPRDESTRQRY